MRSLATMRASRRVHEWYLVHKGADTCRERALPLPLSLPWDHSIPQPSRLPSSHWPARHLFLNMHTAWHSRPNHVPCFAPCPHTVARRIRATRPGACTNSKSAAPPADLHWRSLVSDSNQIAKQRFPDLADLFDVGTLVAWCRPHDYLERREDGYVEPELVLMVGTAHVSERSTHDVTCVIRSACPDAVVVELCRSRSAVMAEPPLVDIPPESQQQEAGSQIQVPGMHIGGGGAGASAGVLSLTGGGKAGGSVVGALSRSMWLGGQSGLLLRLMLSAVSRRTAGAMGVMGGGEFLAARRAAEEVEAQVVLGDRPIEITLQRAWEALGNRQKARLCWDLAQGAMSASSQSLTSELVERYRSDDALAGLMAALGERYPELVEPLITERDQYLAWSLKRSKAVRGCKVVVGVVGAGHMRGVVHALCMDKGGDTLRFSDLVGNMNRSDEKRKKAVQAAGRFGVELGLGLLAYAAWVQLST